MANAVNLEGSTTKVCKGRHSTMIAKSAHKRIVRASDVFPSASDSSIDFSSEHDHHRSVHARELRLVEPRHICATNVGGPCPRRQMLVNSRQERPVLRIRSEMRTAGFARLIIDPLYCFPGCGGWVKTASEGSLNQPEREAGSWRDRGKGDVSRAALSAQ